MLAFDAKGSLGHSLLLKAENPQPSGSFKIRGPAYCLSLLLDQQKAAGVIAYSTGNHAQSVAIAVKSQGVHATVVMADPSSKARRKLAEELAILNGYYLVPPYDHVDVITEQGSIGVEIMQDVNSDAVFVPVGGGGLISGIAVATKKMNPRVKIIGVERELENDAFLSFKFRKRVSLDSPSVSIVDAIKVQVLGDITILLFLIM